MKEQKIIIEQIIGKGLEREALKIKQEIAGISDPTANSDNCRQRIAALIKEMADENRQWGLPIEESEA